MSSNVSNICADISAVLLAAGYTVTVDYCPELDIPKSREFYLFPIDESIKLECRMVKVTNVVLSLVMLEKISKSDRDSRIQIMEGISSMLLGKSLSHGTVVECNFSPLYESDWLRQAHVFISNLQINVRLS